jgi:hypothetical protein
MPRNRQTAETAPSTEDERSGVQTRSRNKEVHPAQLAGVTPRPRAPKGQSKKTRQKAARKDARIAKEKEMAETVSKLAELERTGTLTYADQDTPRAEPATKSLTHRGRRAIGRSAVQIINHKGSQASSSHDLAPSESDSSSKDFTPESTEDSVDEEGEDEDVTDELTDLEATTRKKGKATKRKKRPYRSAIDSINEDLSVTIDVDQEGPEVVTPKPRRSKTKRDEELTVGALKII